MPRCHRSSKSCELGVWASMGWTCLSSTSHRRSAGSIKANFVHCSVVQSWCSLPFGWCSWLHTMASMYLTTSYKVRCISMCTLFILRTSCASLTSADWVRSTTTTVVEMRCLDPLPIRIWLLLILAQIFTVAFFSCFSNKNFFYNILTCCLMESTH